MLVPESEYVKLARKFKKLSNIKSHPAEKLIDNIIKDVSGIDYGVMVDGGDEEIWIEDTSEKNLEKTMSIISSYMKKEPKLIGHFGGHPAYEWSGKSFNVKFRTGSSFGISDIVFTAK